MKFPAIREETLYPDRPVLKDGRNGYIIHFSGPCNHDLLGTEEVFDEVGLKILRDGSSIMKVTVLDDYQSVFASLPAIDRLRRKAQVQIYTETFPSEETLIRALEGSKAIIPIRERTQFSASLLKALPDLELIAQTGNQVYHIDIPAATEAGILITTAPGGYGVTELTIGLIIAVMRRIPERPRNERWKMASASRQSSQR